MEASLYPVLPQIFTNVHDRSARRTTPKGLLDDRSGVWIGLEGPANRSPVSIDLPHIEGIADAKIGVKPSDSSNSTITFTGPVAVTFGFAVMEIAWNGGKWVVQSAPSSPVVPFVVAK